MLLSYSFILLFRISLDWGQISRIPDFQNADEINHTFLHAK
jgi:hypothetical protein